MATKSDVDELADKVAKSLQLESGGPLLDIEEVVYKATPTELEALRKQVLQKQTLSGFDDEGLVKRFVSATKPKGTENGSGDNQSYFNCFQNQIMLPTVLDSNDQLPEDLQKNWLCLVCPQGTRVLVIASHESTRVYDLEGTWICEHDTHLPGGSPSPISQVDDENECTILDCLYNDDQEIYYAVDLLCWKGVRYYKYEASVRLATLLEKLKDVPTLKGITQTNPFRFFSVPMTSSCHQNEVCKAIKRASFELTGLLFYHKKALYLPGLSPLGAWVETTYIPTVLDIQVHMLQYEGEHKPNFKRDWRKNRYEMTPEQVTPVHNSAYVTESHRNAQRNKAARGGHNRNFGQGGGQFVPRPNLPFGQPFCPPFPDYNSGYMNLSGYRAFGFGSALNYGNFLQQQQQRFGQAFHNQNQAFRDNRKGNLREKVVHKAKQEKVVSEKGGKKAEKGEVVEGEIGSEKASATSVSKKDSATEAGRAVENEAANAEKVLESEKDGKKAEVGEVVEGEIGSEKASASSVSEKDTATEAGRVVENEAVKAETVTAVDGDVVEKGESGKEGMSSEQSTENLKEVENVEAQALEEKSVTSMEAKPSQKDEVEGEKKAPDDDAAAKEDEEENNEHEAEGGKAEECEGEKTAATGKAKSAKKKRQSGKNKKRR